MSFLEGVLPEPSARVEQALTKELELRRNQALATLQFSAADGYLYRGGADLTLRHGRFYPGRALPGQYEHLTGPHQHCFDNALRAAVEDDSLRYCEGYYHVGFGAPRLHAWCVDPDGGAVELTFPTNAADLPAMSRETGMRFLPTEHWGYYGTIFGTAYVVAHDATLGLPLLDRGAGELQWVRQRPEYNEDDYTSLHDYPTLKLPYDPNRTELT